MGKSGRRNRAASGLTPADPGHAPGKQHLDRSAERRPTGDGSYGRGIVGRVVRKTRSLRGRG